MPSRSIIRTGVGPHREPGNRFPAMAAINLLAARAARVQSRRNLSRSLSPKLDHSHSITRFDRSRTGPFLTRRGLIGVSSPVLRYHPACFYKGSDEAPPETWPALLAAISDVQGTILGVHRTWLDRSGLSKAPVAEPRKSIGHQIGNGARFSGLAAGLMVVSVRV